MIEYCDAVLDWGHVVKEIELHRRVQRDIADSRRRASLRQNEYNQKKNKTIKL